MAFDWLEPYKRRLQQQRQRRPVNWAQMSLAERYGGAPGGAMVPTGYGPDGRLQPDQPAGMTPNGTIVHEGEGIQPGAGGNNLVMDAGATQVLAGRAGAAPMQPATTPAQQQQLRAEEQMGRPGLKEGGFEGTLMTGNRRPWEKALTGGESNTETDPSSPFGGISGGAKEGRTVGEMAFNPTPVVAGATGRTGHDSVNVSDIGKGSFGGVTGGVTAGKQTRELEGANRGGYDRPAWGAKPVVKGNTVTVTSGPAFDPKPVATPPPETSIGEAGGAPGMEDRYRSMAMGRIASTMRGGSEAQDVATRRYMDDLAAQQATERMVAAQQAAQGRLGEGVGAARAAMQDRMHGSEMGQVAAQGGIAQLQAQEQAAQTLAGQALAGQQLDLSRERFDFEKQKYGDAETQRMADDIAAGLTYEQMAAKYPNLDRGDYENMRGTIMYEQDQQRRRDTFNATAGYVDQQLVTNPEYISSGAWREDTVLHGYLASQWEAHGMEGQFDMSNPAHAAWAETQVESMGMSDIEISINRYRSQAWYRDLEPEEQAEVEALFAVLPQLEATQGYRMAENADGSTYIVDAQGTVVYGEKKSEGGGFDSRQVGDVIEWVANNVGQDIDASRAAQWLRDHNGEAPTSVEQWNAWQGDTPNAGLLHEYFSGVGGVPLTTAERKQLQSVLSAVAAVQAGNASAEQQELAAAYPEIGGYREVPSTTNTSKGYNFHWKHTGNLGNSHVTAHYTWSVYRPTTMLSGGDDWDDRIGFNLEFTPEFKSWLRSAGQTGEVFNYNGVNYRITSANPIVTETRHKEFTEGDDTWSMPYTIQLVQATNLETGEAERLEFNYDFTWADQD